MHFYMIIGKNSFHAYRLSDTGLEPEFIDGNPFFPYNPHTIKTDVGKFLSSIADSNNLDSTDNIEMSVVLNADRVRNVNTLNALGNKAKDKIPAEDILIRLVNNLSKNNELHIDEFGINYDGESYLMMNGKLQTRPYSLLAYTIKQEEFVSELLGR